MDGWMDLSVKFLFSLALGREWGNRWLGVGGVDDVLSLYCMFMCGDLITKETIRMRTRT